MQTPCECETGEEESHAGGHGKGVVCIFNSPCPSAPAFSGSALTGTPVRQGRDRVSPHRTIPFGKLPILEVDGVIIHQSLAMARYLAREAGVAGQTPVEQALADAIVDTIDDFMTLFPWAEKNQDVRKKAFDDILTNKAPELLKDLDTFLGDKKWLVGNSVTWADFYWDVCSTTLLSCKPDLADKYPRLLALRERVQALPAIAAWIQKRPKSVM
uniref:glutathione transferase n=1 Tax=Serinus canaria TaxID=9135 RepID=A0A8C9NJM0_SERCA